MAPPETHSSFTTTSNAHEHDLYSRTTHSYRTQEYGKDLRQGSPLPPQPHIAMPPQPHYTATHAHPMHTPSPSNRPRQRTRSSPSPPPHSHHLPSKNGKRPSLASPLPPSPLVPPAPDMVKRFMPAPLNLTGSSASSSSAYQHHRRPGTAGSQSGSVSGLSSPPISPKPSPPHELHGTHHHHPHPHPPASKSSSTHHAQYVTVQARPYTANGTLPESPSTAAMMRRLLAKPAPLGGGGGSTSGGLTSGSESEGWTSGGMGYIRKKVEGSPQQVHGHEDMKVKEKVKRKPSLLRKRASANNISANAASSSASSSKASFHSNSHSNATSPKTPISSGGLPPSLPPPPIFSPLSLSPINGPSTSFLIPSSSGSHPTSNSQTILGAGLVAHYSPQANSNSHPANLLSSYSTSRPNPNSTRTDHLADGAMNSHNHSHNSNHNQSHQSHQNQTNTHSHHHPPSSSSHNTAAGGAAISSRATSAHSLTHDGATGPASNSSSPSSVSVSHRQHNNHHFVTSATLGKNFSQSGYSQRHAASTVPVPPPPLPSPTYLQSQSSSNTKAMQRSLSASAVLPGANGNSGSGTNRKGRQQDALAAPSHHNSLGTTAPAIRPAARSKTTTVTTMLDSLRPPLPHTRFHTDGSSSPSASRGSSRTRGSRTSSPPRSPVLSSFTNTGSNSNSLTVVPGSGYGSTGTPSPTSLVHGAHTAQKERDREKDKEGGRLGAATPAASLIEAYKRQEKEREEREKERAARRQREEEARRNSRTQQRKTMLVGLHGLDGGDKEVGMSLPKARSQPSSRRHSFSLLSPQQGSSSAATSASSSPVATVRRTATANAAVPITDSNSNSHLLSPFAALERRKNIQSFASGHTTDSAQDLIIHVDDEPTAGVAGGKRGFEVIEKMVEHYGLSNESLMAGDATEKDDESKIVPSSSIPSVTQPHTPDAASEPTRESLLATPYYTVVGTSSGRVVAVGSREDSSWSSYGMGYWESGVMSRQGQTQGPVQGERATEKGKDKEKEKMSIGKSLTRKMSGRWKKQGGVVVGTLNSPLTGEDEGRGRMLGRGSMQEKRAYAPGGVGEQSTRSISRSRSRPRKETDEEERRMRMKNRRSLRLSIDKFDDRLPTSPLRHGHGHGSNVDVSDGEAETVETTEATAVMAETAKKLRKAQKQESSPSATSSPGGSKIWRLMKRISIGSGLRDKFHDSAGDSPPPVPALPKNAHTLHASRSTDSSFKNGSGSNSKIGSKGSSSASSSPTQAVIPSSGRYGSSPVTDAPPAARSSSKPPSSPLTTTVTTATQALPLSNPTSNVASTTPAPLTPSATPAQSSQPRQSTTTRSSSPVFSSSSDVASSRFFHRTISARSSTSSLGFGELPPPMPSKPMAMLGQHIVAPSELRKVDSATNDGELGGVGEKGSKRALPPRSIPIPIPRPTLSQRPSTAGGAAGDLRQLPDDDWMIVKSPDVELPSLPLPPPRRVATLPTPAAVSSTSTDTMGDAAAAGAASWDALDDVDEMSEGGGSPIIPTFSTEEPANVFPTRRASASTTLSPTSMRRLASSPTSPSRSAGASIASHSGEAEPRSATASSGGNLAGGIAASSSSPPRLPPLGLSAGLNLGSPTSPPPPRPQRSSQRPPPPPSSTAGSPPSAASPLGAAMSPPSSAVFRSQVLSPRADDIPIGRKSESHAVRPPNSLTSRHNSASQRRSISIGSPSHSLSLSSSSSSSSRPGTSHTPLHRSASSSVVPSTLDAEYSLDRDLDATSGGGEKSENKRKFALTEQEKAERWADLLERSEKAGGTLRVEVGGLASLGGGLKRGLGFR